MAIFWDPARGARAVGPPLDPPLVEPILRIALLLAGELLCERGEKHACLCCQRWWVSAEDSLSVLMNCVGVTAGFYNTIFWNKPSKEVWNFGVHDLIVL